jgi:hypothetical protein
MKSVRRPACGHASDNRCRAAIANPKHMIRLTSAARAAFAALLFPSSLQLSDDRKHVVQTLVLDDFGSCIERNLSKVL